MICFTRPLFAVALGLCLVAGSARASQVVFGNLGGNGLGSIGSVNVNITGSDIRAQSFTVGLSSTFLTLDKVRLGLGVVGGGSQNATISLWGDNGFGLPSSSIATSESVFMSGDTAASYDFVFSGVNLVQGATYWVAVGAGSRWYSNFDESLPEGQNSSGYSYDGAARSQTSGSTWTTIGDRDYSIAVFASEAGPEPIPEPGTWAAAAVLIGLAGYVRWRRRAQAA